jgi:hypothetical protein
MVQVGIFLASKIVGIANRVHLSRDEGGDLVHLGETIDVAGQSRDAPESGIRLGLEAKID